MGDVVGMAVGMFGTVKSWLMAGGPMWLAAMVLMLMMWFAHWYGTAALRWWAAFLNLVGFVACFALVLFGDAGNINSAAGWGARWLYPLGGMFLFYFHEHARLVLHGSGGGEKH